MKVLGYIRVSTEEQASSGVSLDSQREKIRLYCELHELELVGIEEDPGVSGKSLDRPGLGRARSMLDSGLVEGTVISKLDRLTRSVVDWNELIERHFGESAGKHLFSVGDSIDTRTASGRLVLNVLMSVAQWERETIVERTRSEMRFKRSRSERTGNIPIGSKLNPEDPRRSKKSGLPSALVPCPEDLAHIELIIDLRRQGRSLRAIAEELNERGIPSKRGLTRRSTGRWSKSTIHELLGRSNVL